MTRRQASRPASFIEGLESRTLFNLAPFGADNTLANGTTQPTADVAVAADGSYAVAYFESRVVKLARFSSTGERVGEPITVFSTLRQFAAASDSAGNIVVAYTEDPSSPTEEFDNELWFIRISRSGVISAPQAVDTTAIEHLFPVVSFDKNGGFFIAWAESARFEYQVKARAFDAAGNAHAATFQLDPGRGRSNREHLYHLTAVAKPDGSGLRYAYVEYGQDGYHQVLRFGSASISADGGDAQGMFSKQSPQLAVHADGSFAMAFATINRISSQEDGPTVMFVQRFRANGTSIGKAEQIGLKLADEGLNIDVKGMAATPGGGFIVTYVQNIVDTYRTTLYAQRFDASGRSDDAGPVDYYSENADFNVAGAVHYSGGQRLGVDGAGNAVAIYGTVKTTSNSSNTYVTHVTRLTSAAAAIDHSTLWVLGTRKSEAMSVKQRGGSVFANLGNTSLKFAASRVKGIALEGSNGNDRIFNETLIPSTIRGGSGNDVIQGGGGNDVIRGNAGDDDLSGNDGNDTLIGDAGNDILVGNNGNDRLEGGAGRDRIYGFAGNDAIFASDGELDQLFGNGGRDTFDRDGNDSVVD